ncbi:klp-4 [Pristionchus pacificus]|uniref:Klp-4 n=1 Tax=Pristionchus pacificus TaxID=54126 RepID=A0A2A6BFX7_PRIPA|nr:klp-4 [Pristionchus pacificus]|eukprot:PDM64789.1 klp-4 [Pristionchus pacificus]
MEDGRGEMGLEKGRIRLKDERCQDEVFLQVGSGVLENAFSGYNACIFAYGQTGSGKSYSMMGSSDNPGVIPRLCNSIFQRIDSTASDSLQYKVEVSYMEIYNERVRDLLDPKNKRNLKVREHKVLGPTVDGLSELAVSSFEQIEKLIEEGNRSRTVAATNMNAESSRSHAVFMIKLTQILRNIEKNFSGEKVAKISLVDLAGSERAQKSGAVGKRLEEGGSINKSLTTLGMVISALAEKSNNAKKEKFVPYRDSVLTWLLKDSLGGNSKTVMIATISPASDNYEETLSTLRFADRAKKIVNHAIVNEYFKLLILDPNAKIIRELREEVETLRQQITLTKREHTETEELRERLAESERIVAQMNKSWEERLKETDTLYRERQRDLTEIGISIESSGIKVEKNRFYLVNLNSDPSMNELLVYYITNSAYVGNGEGEKVDIQLQGFGIQSRHALMEIMEEPDMHRLYITPLADDARVCVNGRELPAHERVLLRNGFRVLIGLNHFFRVHCPRENDAMAASMMDESALFGYDDAWTEANNEANANPMTSAVDQYMEQLVIRHQEDKQAALEQQYEAFERYIHGLSAGGFTPFTPSTPMTPGFGLATPMQSTPGSHLPPHPFPPPTKSVRSRFYQWAQKRDEKFADSLARLKSDLIRANAIVKEANLISTSLNNGRPKINYDVTLQIPAANLRPSRIKAGAFVCEPFIVVRRQGMSGCQLWTMEQLECKLVEMREAYEDRDGMADSSASPEDSPLRQLPNGFEKLPDGTAVMDPFFESHENHSLIGVANVFLEVLFHDIKLDYQVPIISQQGEVAGKLHIEVQRVFHSEEEKLPERNRIEYLLGRTITCRVRIKRASALPSSLSHFVFCQYSFFNLSEMLVVPPAFEEDGDAPPSSIHFDDEREFSVVVSEEFLEYVQEDALSIEIWGHRSSGFDDAERLMNGSVNKEEKLLTLQERWAEVTRRLKVTVQLAELNDEGRWACVEAARIKDVATGGVYQLKQGQQRRIRVAVSALSSGGSLPLVVDSISTVAVGCINVRSAGTQRPLDSYQEEDLDRIRTEWTAALEQRQKHLEEQINRTPPHPAEHDEASSREYSLMDQWVALTEERAAVKLPAANSRIPGAPSDWTPPPGVENHVPVIFLNLNPEEVTQDEEGPLVDEFGHLRTAGQHSILPKEHTAPPFIYLPMVDRAENEAAVTCSWDSSLHDDTALNVPTAQNERVYAVVKVTVRLSHPCEMDVVLRKRIALHIYKKTSLTERILKSISRSEPLLATAVHYDVVAHLPKSSHEMEDRSSLAQLAARQTTSTDEETRFHYIEAYTKSIQAIESMLKLDRLRQEVAVSSLLSRKDRKDRLAAMVPNRMKRATSLPNAMANQHLMTSSLILNPLEGTSTAHEVPRSLETSMCSSSDSSSMGKRTSV